MYDFSPAVIGLIGVMVGWLTTHWFTSARDKRTRRGVFVGFLLQWRSTISRKTHSHDVFEAFRDGVHTFHFEFGKVREDYLRQHDFIETAESLGRLSETEIIRDGADGRIPIFTLVDRLVSLVK